MVEQKKVLDRDEVLRILGQHRNDLATRYGVGFSACQKVKNPIPAK